MSKQDKIEELKAMMLNEDSWLWPLGVPGDSEYSKLVMEAAQELGANVQFLSQYGLWDEECSCAFYNSPGRYRLSPKNPARPSLVVRETERFETFVDHTAYAIAATSLWFGFPSRLVGYRKVCDIPHKAKVDVIVKDARTHAEDEALLKRAKELLAMDDKRIAELLVTYTGMFWGAAVRTCIIRNLRDLLTATDHRESGGADGWKGVSS